MTLLAIALGGAAGSVLRYLIAEAIGKLDRFPLGTIVVNVSGACLLGLVATILLERTNAPEALRLGLTVGLLGGYTTFSTIQLEVLQLLDSGEWPTALLYALLTPAAGLAAVWAGQQLARL